MSKWIKNWIWWLVGIGVALIGTAVWLPMTEQPENLTWFADAATKALTIFLFYLAGSVILAEKVYRGWYVIWEVLQGIYIDIGNAVAGHLRKKLSAKQRELLQTGIFALLFLVMIAMDVKSRNQFLKAGRYWVLLYGIFFLILGLLSVEKPLQKLDWCGKVPAAYTALWVVACISDLLVRKSFSFAGYVMLFGVGFLFFIWQNQGQMKTMLLRMMRGLEVTLPVIVVYCICFRPVKEEIWYNGCFTNRESMALYALALILAFVMELYHSKNNTTLLCSVSGLFVSGFYLVASGKRGCCLIALVVICAGLILAIKKQGRKWKVPIILASILLAAGVTAVAFAGIQKLPEKIGHSVTYTREREVEVTGGEISRRTIWTSYAKEWNLTGHKDALKFSGKRQDAANGILQLVYRYGIFIVIPYLILLYQVIAEVIRRRDGMGILILAVYLATLLWCNVEIPFTNPIWLLFYFMVGTLFEQEKIANEKEM